MEGTDQEGLSTSPTTTLWVLITLDDVAEAPTITGLPSNTSLSEDHTLSQDLVTITATDDDLGDSATMAMTTSPSGAPFSFNAGSELL